MITPCKKTIIITCWNTKTCRCGSNDLMFLYEFSSIFFGVWKPSHKQNIPTLRIMGSQKCWFGDPRPVLYTSKPLYSRVQWFLGSKDCFTLSIGPENQPKPTLPQEPSLEPLHEAWDPTSGGSGPWRGTWWCDRLRKWFLRILMAVFFLWKGGGYTATLVRWLVGWLVGWFVGFVNVMIAKPFSCLGFIEDFCFFPVVQDYKNFYFISR